MKLKKSPCRRFQGYTTLVDTASTTRRQSIGTERWNKDEKELFLSAQGSDTSGIDYDYDLHISGEELARFIELALTQASDNVAIRTHAKAMGAFIREVLSDKSKKKKKT